MLFYLYMLWECSPFPTARFVGVSMNIFLLILRNCVYAHSNSWMDVCGSVTWTVWAKLLIWASAGLVWYTECMWFCVAISCSVHETHPGVCCLCVSWTYYIWHTCTQSACDSVLPSIVLCMRPTQEFAVFVCHGHTTYGTPASSMEHLT